MSFIKSVTMSIGSVIKPCQYQCQQCGALSGVNVSACTNKCIVKYKDIKKMLALHVGNGSEMDDIAIDFLNAYFTPVHGSKRLFKIKQESARTLLTDQTLVEYERFRNASHNGRDNVSLFELLYKEDIQPRLRKCGCNNYISLPSNERTPEQQSHMVIDTINSDFINLWEQLKNNKHQ